LKVFLKLGLRILEVIGIGQLFEPVREEARNARVSRLKTTIEQDSTDNSLYSVSQCRVAVRTA